MNLEQLDHAELVRRIEFGIEVEHALGQRILRYLTRRAEEHRQAALEQLAHLDPYDEGQRRRINELRLEVAAVDRWQEWLAEAIQVGRQAQEVLIESERGE